MEASVLPNPAALKRPAIGPGSGQHTDPVTGKMSMKTLSTADAIASSNAQMRDKVTGKAPTLTNTSAPTAGAPASKVATPIMDRAVQTQKTAAPVRPGDKVPGEKVATNSQLSAQVAARAAAKRGFGSPAGGDYSSAVKKNPSISAREPDEKTGSTGGRSGMFGMAQTRRDNQAATSGRKAAEKIAQQRRDSKLGAAAVAYEKKTGEGVLNGIKQRNADAMSARGKVAPTIAADNAAVAGTKKAETRDEKWKRSINDPRTQARANGDEYRPAKGTLGDKLQKTVSVSHDSPKITSQAQAAAAAKSANMKGGGAGNPAPAKSKEMSWSQKVGKAMRDHVKKGGKAGDTITIDGKKIKVAWKDEAYQKRLTKKYVKEAVAAYLNENRVVKKTAKSMLAHPKDRLARGQQSVSGGRRYRIRTKPLVSEADNKKEKPLKKGEKINFEPENNNPIQ